MIMIIFKLIFLIVMTEMIYFWPREIFFNYLWSVIKSIITQYVSLSSPVCEMKRKTLCVKVRSRYQLSLATSYPDDLIKCTWRHGCRWERQIISYYSILIGRCKVLDDRGSSEELSWLLHVRIIKVFAEKFWK